MSWIKLQDINQLNKNISKEKDSLIVLFKHSTGCLFSKIIFFRFKKTIKKQNGQLTLYYLDVLKYRELSNEIASQYNIQHETPQVLVIKNGQLMTSASHSEILSINFQDYTD